MLENFSQNKNKIQVLTKDGFKNFKGVNFTGEKTGYEFITENNYILKCSKEHLIKTPHCKMKAKDLKVGNIVITEKGFEKIIFKKKISKKFKCFDLVDVESSDHTYFANKIQVSNCAIISTPMWEEFYTSSYPVITESKEAKIILVSTPKGKNHFYEISKNAKEGKNNFKYLEVGWDLVPGRDEIWKEETIRNLGFNGLFKFLQEYNCEFISSDNTLISPAILKYLDYSEPIEFEKIDELQELLQYKEFISVFETKKENECYSIGFDSAKMTLQNANDSICIQVLKVTNLPFEQVFTMTIDKGLSYLELAPILATLIRYYKGICFIENNGEGQEIANILYYDYDFKDEIFCEKIGLTGFRTTVKTKKIGCTFLKVLLENSKIILKNKETIFQLTSFVKKGNSFAAEKGFYDDAVMALISCLFFLQIDDNSITNLFDEKIKIPDKINFSSAILLKNKVDMPEKKYNNNKEEEEEEEEAINVDFNFYENYNDDDYNDDDDYYDDNYKNFYEKTFKNL